MSYLLWQADAGVGVASARQVLRADEVPPLQEANALLQALTDTFHGQGRRLQQELETAHRRGLAQGLEDGRLAAQQELAQTLQRLEAQAAQDSRQRREAVAALALQVARKIIGELPQADRLAALAAHAAQELLPARTLRLHVAPAMVEPVRERLATLAQPATGLVQARVLADPGLGPDACRLETDLGSADAGLEAQLERLASVLGVGPAA